VVPLGVLRLFWCGGRHAPQPREEHPTMNDLRTCGFCGCMDADAGVKMARVRRRNVLVPICRTCRDFGPPKPGYDVPHWVAQQEFGRVPFAPRF